MWCEISILRSRSEILNLCCYFRHHIRSFLIPHFSVDPLGSLWIYLKSLIEFTKNDWIKQTTESNVFNACEMYMYGRKQQLMWEGHSAIHFNSVYPAFLDPWSPCKIRFIKLWCFQVHELVFIHSYLDSSWMTCSLYIFLTYTHELLETKNFWNMFINSSWTNKRKEKKLAKSLRDSWTQHHY